MIDVSKYKNLPPEIKPMLDIVGISPRLQTVWALMDVVWERCNASFDDTDSLAKFYSHPVWILNGMFIEQDELSMKHRDHFVLFIKELFERKSCTPKRIADYGGGFGTFARMLATIYPQCQVEIVEPFPSETARCLCEKFSNITFTKNLSGKYDLIVAMDVLEHVSCPLQLVHDFGEKMGDGSFLFTANCFFPVIKCHDPKTFYLGKFFPCILKKMGFVPEGEVLYAQCFSKASRLVAPDTCMIKLYTVFWEKIFLVYSILRNIRNVLRCQS